MMVSNDIACMDSSTPFSPWLMPPAAGGNEPDPRHTGDGPSHGLVVIAARIHSPRLINFSRSSGLSACSATSKLLELLC